MLLCDVQADAFWFDGHIRISQSNSTYFDGIVPSIFDSIGHYIAAYGDIQDLWLSMINLNLNMFLLYKYDCCCKMIHLGIWYWQSKYRNFESRRFPPTSAQNGASSARNSLRPQTTSECFISLHFPAIQESLMSASQVKFQKVMNANIARMLLFYSLLRRAGYGIVSKSNRIWIIF